MKTDYISPQLDIEHIAIQCGIAVSPTDPSEFDLIINGFGEEEEW